MRYQITCDNCGTQFLIDAEPGKTIECQCPGCHGMMQITLPNAAKGEHYQAPQDTDSTPAGAWQAETVEGDGHPNRRWLWVAIAVLVVAVVAIGVAMFSTGSPQPEEPAPVTADTIPYEQPIVEEKPQEQVDTIVEQPEEPQEEIEEMPQEETEVEHEAGTDSVAVN